MHHDPVQLSFLFILILGLSLSVLSGVVGSFVLASRTSSLLGTITHAMLAGFGLAVYFDWNRFLCIMLVGVLIGILIGIITIKDPKNKEMLMSAIWSIGMALGVILLHQKEVDLHQKGVDGEEIMHALFGNIENLYKEDIIILSVGSLCVIGFILYYFKNFVSLTSNLKQSMVPSESDRLMYLLLLGVISFTAILMVKFVGIILVLSLLSLPAAIAMHFNQNIPQQIIYGIVLAMIMTFGGLGLSFLLYWPIGATITLFSGICYLPVLLSNKSKEG